MINIKEENIVHDTLFKIAHEVKNPLAIALGYLQMLNNDTNMVKVLKYLPKIDDEVRRSVMILDDFLNCTKISVNKEMIDLYYLIEEVSDSLEEHFLDNNLKIDCLIPDTELYINGDYDKLRQVFVNVLKNSYEANANVIKIFTEIENDYVSIYIVDNGDGINDDVIDRIGEMFFTTKINGTGVGVNFSREIVRLHDGCFKIDNNKRGGVVVTIKLPI